MWRIEMLKRTAPKPSYNPSLQPILQSQIMSIPGFSVLGNDLTTIEIGVNDMRIAKLHNVNAPPIYLRIVTTGSKQMLIRCITRQTITKIIIRSYRSIDKHVVVEDDKLLTQTFYSMQIILNCISLKRRQKLFGNKITMIYKGQFRVIKIKPRWALVISYEINMTHPRSISVYSAKPIFQYIPVAIPNRSRLLWRPLIASFLLLPFRVRTIYPKNDKIYLHPFYYICMV